MMKKRFVRSKKGAMEMSVNTIVVIVIGVTLLVLGLAFVKNMFERFGGQADVIFGNVENQLSDIATHDQKLTVQPMVPVKQGEQAFFTIWVVNLNDAQGKFSIKAVPSSGNKFGERVSVEFANPSANLDVGEEAGFVVGVASKDNAPLTSGGYTVTVKTEDGRDYANGAFFVKVEK
jgi:hypothetical protein